MPRIQPIEMDEASGDVRQTLQDLERQLGTLPNVFKIMALSPAVLSGYLAASQAVSRSGISAQLREKIAVAAAGANECDYCASAHTHVGKRRGIEPEELGLNLVGQSNDPKDAAVLKFVQAVLTHKGELTDDELDSLRKTGLSDREVVELIFYIGLTTTANYLNKIAQTEIDFPLVSSLS